VHFHALRRTIGYAASRVLAAHKPTILRLTCGCLGKSPVFEQLPIAAHEPIGKPPEKPG
jgi:hypothetical protein